jgi:signal transduction histidine kinase
VTGLLVLTLVPALAALMFWLRARAEMRARRAAEARLAELQAAFADSRPGDGAEFRRRLFAIVAHELRSPISAILGYQELLAEGLLGPLSDRSLDATGRIRNSALQLLNLTDGMYELAGTARAASADGGEVALDELIADVVQRAAVEGAGRGVEIVTALDEPLPTLRSDTERLCRTLDLLIAAAIKTSPEAVLRIEAAAAHDGVTISIAGTRLDPDRDVPRVDAPDAVTTGAGLRIAMARACAAAIGARLDVTAAADSTRVELRVPHLD